MIELLVGIVGYFVTSLGSIAIVKYLNYFLCFKSWLLVALLSRSTWIFSCPLHWVLQRLEDVSLGVTRKQLRLYFFIAIGLSVVELFNALSMSMLPGSWYVLLKGSDVGFSMALSRWILGKRFHLGQMFGAGFVMGGIGVVFFVGSPGRPVEETREEAAIDNSISMTVVSVFCMFGACLNAGCSVLTEATLKQTLKEEAHRTITCGEGISPSKLLLSNAFSMWTTLFSFAILSVPAILSGQLPGAFQDVDEVSESCSQDDVSTVNNVSALLSFMLLLLGASRFGERLSKDWICFTDSAVAFSLVQTARRLSGIFILAALFRESFPQSMILGTSCSAIGLSMHFWYGHPMITVDEDGSVGKLAPHEYELVETRQFLGEAFVHEHDDMHVQ